MSHIAPHTAPCVASTTMRSRFIGGRATAFRFLGIALFGLAALAPAGNLSVYAQTNTGSIRGSVTDATQAVILGATVTAIDESRGVEQQAVETGTGGFVFSHLVPGMYTLRFEAPNFAPLTVEGFEVRVGEVSTFSPALEVAATATQVVVSAVSTRLAIEPERVQQSDYIDSVRIQNLPINRRDYLDLALLTPGVVDTNHVANAIDRRITPTPSSGLGIGGGNGRGNTFTIDGLDNLYNSGGVRSSIGQDAVQEFQVNRNSFSTEQGGAPGGAINIVTKGGTNELHGTLFGVLRNRRFQARNHFDPGKAAYTRAQSGMSIGGPIEPNRTFFYAAYERLDRHESQIVPLLSDRSFLTSLTESQQSLVDVLRVAAPTLSPVIDQLAGALVPANNPSVLSLFETNSGVFPFGELRQQVIARIDHTPGGGHTLFVRGNWTGQDSDNINFGALTARNRGSNSNVKDFALALGDTWVINPQWVSETRLGLGYHDFGVYPTDTFGPAIDIGAVSFGRDFILPVRNIERFFQVRQNFMRVSGRQTLRFGADVNPLRDSALAETFFSGRFVFGEAVPLSSIIDNAVGAGTSRQLQGLLSLAGAPHLASAVDEPISAVQAFSLGLPTVYQQGFGNPTWQGWSNRMNFFVEDSVRVSPSFLMTLGLRYELELKTRFPGDYNNFAPRAGFAWNPDPATVIRGGFGIYYSRIQGYISLVNDLLGERQQINQVFIPLTGLPGIDSPLTGGRLTSAEIYQTLLARGVLGQRSILPEDLAPHGIVPGPGYPLRIGFRVAQDVVNPYSMQGSLEIQREVAGYAVSAAYNFNRGLHLIRPLDPNVFQAGADPVTGRPVPGFHNPLIYQDNVYGSWGTSDYHALIVQLEKRLSDGFSISAHHTWSKAMDEATDYNSSYEPHIPWDARNERSLSAYHRGHRFVANVVAQSPWEAARGRGFGNNLLADFTLSGIVTANSFAPYNLTTGFDSLGDRHTDTHRPFGLGRNAGIGPNFFSVDMRLTREFPLSEAVSLQVTGEAFNLLNRTNFKTVNGVVGDASLEDLPERLVGRRGPVTEPFSFASAFDPRQFQFGLRLTF